MSAEKKSWGTCAECGKTYAPDRMVERLAGQLGEKAGVVDTCPACRRTKAASELLEAGKASTD